MSGTAITRCNSLSAIMQFPRPIRHARQLVRVSYKEKLRLLRGGTAAVTTALSVHPSPAYLNPSPPQPLSFPTPPLPTRWARLQPRVHHFLVVRCALCMHDVLGSRSAYALCIGNILLF